VVVANVHRGGSATAEAKWCCWWGLGWCGLLYCIFFSFYFLLGSFFLF